MKNALIDILLLMIIYNQVKKEAAETEEAWEKAGQVEGVQVWRINKFKVSHFS